MASPDFQASAQSPSAGNADSGQIALNKLNARASFLQSRKQLAANIHLPTTNTAAVVTKTAVSGQYHVIRGVAFSYSATPTGGNLKIEDVSGTTVFSVDIADATPRVITFPVPIRSAAVNTAMIVTLAAGGGGISGKVNVLGYSVES